LEEQKLLSKSMIRLTSALGLTALSSLANAATPVTLDTFARAESDYYMSVYVAKGCFGTFCHNRAAPTVDQQDVIRMNLDTLYSAAIVDLSSPVTITMPDVSGRFQSLQVVNQDHFVPIVVARPGTYTLTQEAMGTRYVALLVRTFMNPNDPIDMQQVHCAQDGLRLSQEGVGKWEVPDWDQAQRKKLSTTLASLVAFSRGSEKTFGKAGDVDPVRHLVGSAAGWGGNPVADAKYISVTPALNDGVTPMVLTVRDVPVNAFWSIIVYNAKGYFEAPQSAASVNSVTGKRNKDGSMTIRFGGNPGAANYLRIMPGWNYTVRLYEPRAEIISGRWTFPAAVPAK
jgi:hypothetical protein